MCVLCFTVLSLRLAFFCCLNTILRVFFNSNQELSHDCQNILISLCSKSQSAPPTMAGNILVRGGAGQRQADLWGAVFCCMVVNYGLACVTLPAATFTFHPQLTLQNIDYTHTHHSLACFSPAKWQIVVPVLTRACSVLNMCL